MTNHQAARLRPGYRVRRKAWPGDGDCIRFIQRSASVIARVDFGARGGIRIVSSRGIGSTERYDKSHALHWERAGYVAGHPDFAGETVCFRHIASQ